MGSLQIEKVVNNTKIHSKVTGLTVSVEYQMRMNFNIKIGWLVVLIKRKLLLNLRLFFDKCTPAIFRDSRFFSVLQTPLKPTAVIFQVLPLASMNFHSGTLEVKANSPAKLFVTLQKSNGYKLQSENCTQNYSKMNLQKNLKIIQVSKMRFWVILKQVR